MRSSDSKTIFMVDYETDSSVVREYMTTIDYQKLLSSERNGSIKIMNLMKIGNVNEKAAQPSFILGLQSLQGNTPAKWGKTIGETRKKDEKEKHKIEYDLVLFKWAKMKFVQ